MRIKEDMAEQLMPGRSSGNPDTEEIEARHCGLGAKPGGSIRQDTGRGHSYEASEAPTTSSM